MSNGKTYKIVVLPDGDTWDLAKGTKIMELTEAGYDKLLSDEYIDNLTSEDVLSTKEID